MAGGIRPRILIVEDEMIIAMMLEDMLDELGYEIAATAARPAQALEAIAARPIDVAVLDVNLGGDNSYGIAGALRQRGIPFLFSTGYAGLTLEEPYRDHRVLQKPYRQEDLARALETILRDRHARPDLQDS